MAGLLASGGIAGFAGVIVGVLLTLLWIWLCEEFNWDIWPHTKSFCENVK
jgi:predicted PurR-regulated permease PerM